MQISHLLGSELSLVFLSRFYVLWDVDRVWIWHIIVITSVVLVA